MRESVMTKPRQQRSLISAIGLQATNVALVLATLLLSLVVCPAAQAQLKVLYSFKGGADGNTPVGRLLRSNQTSLVRLVGTTSTGGTDGQGTIFELERNQGKWEYKILHSFDHTKAEGAAPVGSLVQDPAGNLYGTTSAGGDANCSCGTVFKLDTHNVLTVLYRFTGKPDGAYPYAGLARDRKGNLFGTTQHGGLPCKFNPGDCGVVFKIDPSGKKTILHYFTGGWDGGVPGYSALTVDHVGVLYGTTSLGGQVDFAGIGSVFELHQSGRMKVLYSFNTGLDGSQPLGGVLLFGNNLYGTTSQGGTGGGWGTVFDVDILNGTENVLYSFTDHLDGGFPQSDLVAASNGQLFWGTTYNGGDFSDCPGAGCGTIFSVPDGGGEKVLWKFTNNDGAYPWSGPIRIGKALYGTASNGGDFGVGVVYELPLK
jgi:uncharacterized repeat protein (TIGR03803 family)